MDEQLHPFSGRNPPEGLPTAVKAICLAVAILIFGMPAAAGIIWLVSETVEHFTP